MRKNLLLFFVFLSANYMFGQGECNYNLIVHTHINCYGENTGSIEIDIPNSNASFWWKGPDGYSATTLTLSNLFAGDYIIHITDSMPTSDSTAILLCYNTDTISVNQTIDIQAEFHVYGMCAKGDSADIVTDIIGGTFPYSTLWSTGDTARNTTNLPVSILPHILTITDINNCVKEQYLTITDVLPMESYMSAEYTSCKDDNRGKARVFVDYGTPPFNFIWSTDTTYVYEHDSFSVIEGLVPGLYTVQIEDNQNCTKYDTIELIFNPEVCLSVNKVFSPNEDGINDFWEINNIHLYPNALVEVYSRSGRLVFRRRNYINAEKDSPSSISAFGGKDDKGNRLPSSTYYYIIDLENGDKVLTGTVTIVR